MRKAPLFAALVALALTVAAARAAAADEGEALRGVWVATSGSVDTSSVQAIVNGLVKPGQSDEQKVMAVFNWYRRVIYPHRYMAADRRDVLRQINSYGCTLCGSHAANLGYLMRAAGFKTRCVFIYGGGHTFIEVWYDDAWHAVDPETDFAVWSRAKPGEKPHLISMEELKADPTLIDDPIAEGRAKPWFFKAMRFPFAQRKTMADYCDHNGLPKVEMQWSSGVLKGMTIKDYFVRGVRSVRYSGENDAYGGHVSDPDLMKLTLRPNETLTRCWDNLGRGKWITRQGFEQYPAHFMAAGGADESDPEVFPYVEPYLKRNYGLPALPVDRCYRYGGNGQDVWSPTPYELATAAGVTIDGLVVDRDGGPLRPKEAGKLATLTIPVRSSYAMACANIRLAAVRGEGDVLRISLFRKGDKKTPDVWEPMWSAEKTGAFDADCFYDRPINGLFDYQLRIEMQAQVDAASVGVKAITFDHVFVNNWLVLPLLTAGKNTIRVRLDNPEALKAVKLTVTYEWGEGDGWKLDKSDAREVTGRPFEYELTTAGAGPDGTKFPRMKRLILRAAPRLQTP